MCLEKRADTPVTPALPSADTRPNTPLDVELHPGTPCLDFSARPSSQTASVQLTPAAIPPTPVKYRYYGDWILGNPLIVVLYTTILYNTLVAVIEVI